MALFWLNHNEVGGNNFSDALLLFCKIIIFGSVIFSGTYCCKFLAYFFLIFGLFLNANLTAALCL